MFSSCGAPVNAAGLRHECHCRSTRVSAKCAFSGGCCRVYHWPCDVVRATPYCALAVRFVSNPSALVLLGCLLAPIACAQRVNVHGANTSQVRQATPGTIDELRKPHGHDCAPGRLLGFAGCTTISHRNVLRWQRRIHTHGRERGLGRAHWQESDLLPATLIHTALSTCALVVSYGCPWAFDPFHGVIPQRDSEIIFWICTRPSDFRTASMLSSCCPAWWCLYKLSRECMMCPVRQGVGWASCRRRGANISSSAQHMAFSVLPARLGYLPERIPRKRAPPLGAGSSATGPHSTE